MEERSERPRSHYQVLGIPEDATPRAVELAFQRWREARRGSRAADAALGECAYRVLSDPRQRAHYDRGLGRLPHPAWAAERMRRSRRCRREGMRHLARGRSEAALAMMLQAVALLPEDPAARSCLALALSRSGRGLHEAARHGEFAVARRPREPLFLFNLAVVYAGAGLRLRAQRLRGRAWLLLLVRMLRPGKAGAWHDA